jgi:hypothetical protein
MKLFQGTGVKKANTSRRVAGALLVATSLALALAGATGANAAKSALARTTRVSPPVTGVGSAVCKMAWVTAQNNLAAPQGAAIANAGTLTMVKPCQGTVIGTFSAEVFTPGAADSLQISVTATCLGPYGQPNPCITGEIDVANPGSIYFQRQTQPDAEANSFTVVWPNLKRGLWKFVVRLTGSGPSAHLGYRTFTVEAFAP